MRSNIYYKLPFTNFTIFNNYFENYYKSKKQLERSTIYTNN